MLRKTLLPAMPLAVFACTTPALAEEPGRTAAEPFVATRHPATGRPALPGTQATPSPADGYGLFAGLFKRTQA